MLQAGDTAPPLDTLDHRGRHVVLDELLQRGPVVVYFYPRDQTRGCTAQACAFRDASAQLAELGCEVIGVSYDSLDSHRAFAELHHLPFSLVADGDHALAKAYGVTGMLNLLPKRVTFLIGAGRKVLGVFHHELDMRAHVRDVLAALRVV